MKTTEEKITDHEFRSGCFRSCPYDHSEHTCEHMIETEDSYIRCGKLQKDHAN